MHLLAASGGGAFIRRRLFRALALTAVALASTHASARAQFRVLPEHSSAAFNHLLYDIAGAEPGTRLPLALAVAPGYRPSPAVVQDFSTSALGPDTRPPAGALSREDLARDRTGDPTLDRDLYARQNLYARWSMMYAASAAVDGRLETAWSEGAPGQGLGEILVIPIPAGTRLEIFSGFALRDDLWQRNSRPRGVGLTVLAPLSRITTSADVVYQDLVVLARDTALLDDRNGFQPLPLPEYARALARYGNPETGSGAPTLFVAIEILSVYQGTQWADTMISEIRPR